MPIFEFICSQCKTEFEILVRGNGEKIICPDCHSPECTKKFSVFGFSSGEKSVSSAGGAKSCSGCGTHNCSGCK